MKTFLVKQIIQKFKDFCTFGLVVVRGGVRRAAAAILRRKSYDRSNFGSDLGLDVGSDLGLDI